jgi:hypothetical protein
MDQSRISRRDLLAVGAAASLGLPTLAEGSQQRSGFLAVSSANGMRTVEEAVRLMKEGRDTLDAAIASWSWTRAACTGPPTVGAP